MPGPLIPLAAGAAAILAGGSKIAAMFAKKRGERIAAEVRAVEAAARSKNMQYAPLREKWAQEFSSLASAEQTCYEQFVTEAGLSADEISSVEVPAEILASLGSLTVLPPPIIDLRSCEAGNAAIRSAAQLMSHSQTLQYTNPQQAKTTQNLAVVAAVSGYISNNFAQVTATDTYEGKAREYMALVAKLVESFAAAFERDLQEDLRNSQTAREAIHSLVQKTRSGSVPNRPFEIVVAAAYRDVLQFLLALSARYSVSARGGSSE